MKKLLLDLQLNKIMQQEQAIDFIIGSEYAKRGFEFKTLEDMRNYDFHEIKKDVIDNLDYWLEVYEFAYCNKNGVLIKGGK